jgi:hypothetical protein
MTQPRNTVTDEAAANFLISPDTRFLLGPFMRSETTMSEAARTLNMELNTFYRRVQQMLALGLVTVTREEIRDGHRVKLYRASCEEFVVSLEATSSVNLEMYLDTVFKGSASILSRGMARAMAQKNPRWGFCISWEEGKGVFQAATALDAEGAPTSSTRDDGASYWYGDSGVRLRPQAAQAFRRELDQLYDKYRQQSDEEGAWHFFFAGFTPT